MYFGIDLSGEAILFDALISPDRGRRQRLILLQITVDCLKKRETAFFVLFSFQKAGADGTGLGFAESGGILRDTLPFGPQFYISLTGLQLTWGGDFDLVLLFALPDLAFTAPLAEDGIIVNDALTVFAFHVHTSRVYQPWKKPKFRQCKSR